MILEVISYVMDGNKTGNDIMGHFGMTRNQFDTVKQKLRAVGLPLIYDNSTKTYSVKNTAILTDEELEVVRRIGKMGLDRRQVDGVLESLLMDKVPPEKKTITFSKDSFKFIVIADIHAGSKFCRKDVIARAAEDAKRNGVDFVFNVGDSIEGMSGRDDQWFNLAQDGFGVSAQATTLATMLNDFDDIKVYSIEAQNSHSGWSWTSHKGAQGINVGEFLELMSIKYGNGQYQFIGFNKADFEINGIRIRLIHPDKGTSMSYVDGLTGSIKPHVVLCGHWHSKCGYVFHRNVHIVDAATAQETTPFIERNASESILGYWVCEMTIGHGPSDQTDRSLPFIESFATRFVPFYSKGVL